MWRCVRVTLMVLAWLVIVPSAAYAQASITGVVRDTSGAVIEPRTTYGERLNQLDLRIGKILHFGRTRATASLDLYNALNSSSVLTLSNAFATWQRPQSIVNARFAKVGFQLNF